MEELEDIEKINNNYLGKKTKSIKKIFKIKEIKKNNQKNINKKEKHDSLLIETSTDLSSSNLINLEEKSEITSKIPNFEDLIIPSFLNDITKYNDINRRIKNYYKLRKQFNSLEMAKLYLIDVNILYEEKKNI